MVAQKVATSKATSSDAKAVHVAKSDLQKTTLKDFDFDVLKTVERIKNLQQHWKLMC